MAALLPTNSENAEDENILETKFDAITEPEYVSTLIMGLKWSPDGRYLACACECGVVKLLNRKGIEISKMKTKSRIKRILWKPSVHTKHSAFKYILLIACTNGHVHHWCATSKKLLTRSVDNEKPINSLAYSNIVDLFATGTSDYNINIYDGQTKKVVCTFDNEIGVMKGHRNRVSCVQFDTDNEHIVYSAGWDRNILIWDLRTPKSVESIICGEMYHESMVITDNFITAGYCPSILSDISFEIFDKRQMSSMIAVDYPEFPNHTYTICSPTDTEYLLGGSNGVFTLNIKDNIIEQKQEISNISNVFNMDLSNEMLVIQGSDTEGDTSFFQLFMNREYADELSNEAAL